MRRRASLKGKGPTIFSTSEEESDEAAVTAAAPSEETSATTAKKPTTRKSRAKKAPAPPRGDEAVVETVVVKAPPVVIAAPAPPMPQAKTPPAAIAAPPPPTSPPPSDTERRAPPPAGPPPAPPTQPPAPTELTTSARYDRLANQIDTLYEDATRRTTVGRGVGQIMQWLSEARRLVVTGKPADFAKAELLVRQVSGLLKHGDEIDQLYADVLEQVGDNPKLVKKCMDWLHEARPKIMTGQMDDLIEAEFLMEEVKGVLTQVKKSRAASNSWGTRVLWGWLVFWLLIFLAAFIFDKPLAEALYARGWTPAGSLPPSSLAQFMLPWLCLVWGAVGSVFDTLIAINEHMAKRTYDGHYIAQGFASPIYGAILGILIYFLFTGGVVAIGTGVAFSSLGGSTSTADVQATATTASRSLALWVVAFLAGFFHNRTFELLGKIFDQILITLKILPEPPKKEGEEEATPPAAGKPTVTVTAPATGAQVKTGETVSVQATAVDAAGVSRVELWADSTLVETQKLPSPQPTVTATLKWTAQAAGGHVLSVKAYNAADAASDPVVVSILVTDGEAVPPPPPPPPPPDGLPGPPDGPPPGDVD